MKLKRYFCFVCQKGFHERQRMLEHLQVHDDGRKSEARFLTDDLKNKLMKDGFVMFEGRKVFKEHVCCHCSKVFRKRQVRMRHALTHHNDKTDILDTNSKEMIKNCVKIEHVKIEQFYRCKLYCMKRYYSETDLAKHVEISDHEGGFFFTCANCPKKFASTKTMKTHSCGQTTKCVPIPVPSHIQSNEKHVDSFNEQTISNTKIKLERKEFYVHRMWKSLEG